MKIQKRSVTKMSCIYCGLTTYNTIYDENLEIDVDVCFDCYVREKQKELDTPPQSTSKQGDDV